MLVVVIDTEADFDWRSHASRRALGVESVKTLPSVQRIFERYSIRPSLVLDYPVSSTPESYQTIRDLYRSGCCEIGAHLQPWDTPPFVEEATETNSYPGNLPPSLERQKLVQLTTCITHNIGVIPRIYKAGRYGLGFATPGILRDLGYEIDVSVVPGTNLTREFGPNFSRCDAHPYWVGGDPPLLEIPLSVGYTGLFSRPCTFAHVTTTNPWLKKLHVPGILARLHLIDRVILTPEGVSFEEQRRLTYAMLRRGHRVFTLAYHSPSLVPGNTPYVRTDAELKILLDRIERFLDFFMGEINGRAATPFDIKQQAMELRGNASQGSGAEG